MLIVNEGAVRPELPGDILARQQLARLLQQHQQNLEWLCVQLDADTLPAEFARSSVGLKDSKAKTSVQPWFCHIQVPV